MVGCMVATSLAMAPAMLVAQRARVVDLDGALLLAKDRPGRATLRRKPGSPADIRIVGMTMMIQTCADPARLTASSLVRVPGAGQQVSHAPDQDDRAAHAGLAGRRGGAAARATSVGRSQAERRGREPPRRRHHHRHEGGRHVRARRPHAAVPELEPRRRAGDVQEPRLRSGQGLRAGRQRRLGLVGHRGAAGSFR